MNQLTTKWGEKSLKEAVTEYITQNRDNIDQDFKEIMSCKITLPERAEDTREAANHQRLNEWQLEQQKLRALCVEDAYAVNVPKVWTAPDESPYKGIHPKERTDGMCELIPKDTLDYDSKNEGLYVKDTYVQRDAKAEMPKYTVKDSGTREQYASGMVRDTATDKVDYSLCLDGPMFERWAAHLTKGAVKYEKRNWLKAEAGSEENARFYESAFRHFLQWLNGDTDEDHAAAVFFNINGAEYCKGKKNEPK